MTGVQTCALPIWVVVPVDHLSAREREILVLAAEGLDNTAIAERLTLSVRTVERHFQNVYLKLGLSGRTARAAAVCRVLGLEPRS